MRKLTAECNRLRAERRARIEIAQSRAQEQHHRAIYDAVDLLRSLGPASDCLAQSLKKLRCVVDSHATWTSEALTV